MIITKFQTDMSVKIEPKQEPMDTTSGIIGGFNISQMLEQITQQVTDPTPEIEGLFLLRILDIYMT